MTRLAVCAALGTEARALAREQIVHTPPDVPLGPAEITEFTPPKEVRP
ncbi:hypothetical protein [Actinomadura violacea]|uniref:Uncharacterized protein n=1 Tax=Actinomadura violacea TaxID=2819934 RepID=A0ABS3SBD8_9ACTN|nr:hypothetical protein [Actinomadura violacea]MBO2465519.1 hypothetical protein [Actinomadura violacea]